MEILTYLAHTFCITKIKAFFTILIGCFFSLVGGETVLVKALFVLMILDYVLGFTTAWMNNNLCKKKMQLGIIKMVAYCITLMVLNYTSIAIMGFNINGFGLLEFGIAYLAVNEALSSLRHLGKMGAPIPVGIINKLESFKHNLEAKDFNSK